MENTKRIKEHKHFSTVHSVRAGYFSWNRNWSRRGSLLKLSMTLFISSVFWLFTLSRLTLGMQRPDRRSSLIKYHDIRSIVCLLPEELLTFCSVIYSNLSKKMSSHFTRRIQDNIAPPPPPPPIHFVLWTPMFVLH